MSNLQKALKEFYGENISDEEIILAEGRLLGFFKLLYKIESRLEVEGRFKDKSNEENYENNGSKN